MAQIKVYCPDIECDSCVRVISKVLKNETGIKDFKVEKDLIDIEFDKEFIKEEKVLEVIKKKGYRAGLDPFERKTFKERFRDFTQNKSKYEIEYKMIKYSLLTFLIILILEFISYNYFFKNQAHFVTSYLWWFFYLDVAVVSLASAMWHLKSYRSQVTSMVGMMIGMTTGMQSGLMIGTILGATNGFFVGALVGMLVGVAVGFFNGKCCGIMGVMEGLMAGVMGGVMGGMLGLMMSVDHILWFMPFFMVINVAILFGLSYMLFEEVVEGREKIQKSALSFPTLFSYCLIVIVFGILLIVYGFKTGLARLVS